MEFRFKNMLPYMVSDSLKNILPSDILKHVLIPITFVKCKKCFEYMDWEEENAARNDFCPHCMFSICFVFGCEFIGTENDFHQVMRSWVCREHVKGNYLSQFCRYASPCHCSKQLSNPQSLASIKKRLEILREIKIYKELKEDHPTSKILTFEGGYYVL